LLERVGLGHRSSAALDELSGGERQRIALARAFAQRPQLLLMDESFASLDDERRAEMRRLLRSLLDEVGTTLILVTHSRNDALDLATRVLVLDRGQPIAAGPLSNVLAEPDHAAAVRSLGLGQILEGHSIGNASADTAFGPVALSHPAAIGRIRLLVRAAQPQISEEGVEAEIIAIELRPPETGSRVRRFGIARAETATLRIELGDHPASIGARIKIRIDGVCRTLDS
jgi:ABC-type sulfate/molybdate transport systems ATPase subunit